MPFWFDNHCHLGADADVVVARALAGGVVGMVTVGCDLADSRAAVATASAHESVWATVGVHPHEASAGVVGLTELLTEPKVVAVGEAGLDFHYDHSPRSAQRDVFAAQIGFANSYNLPLVIHTREAWEETFTLLDKEGIPDRTVFHCFTGGPHEAQESLARGALLSLSGIVTFRAADDLRAAVAICPLDKLMVETDSPYLTPVPHRGKPNEPAFVAIVGVAVAETMGCTVEEVAEATTSNAQSFYDLI